MSSTNLNIEELNTNNFDNSTNYDVDFNFDNELNLDDIQIGGDPEAEFIDEDNEENIIEENLTTQILNEAEHTMNNENNDNDNDNDNDNENNAFTLQTGGSNNNNNNNNNNDNNNNNINNNDSLEEDENINESEEEDSDNENLDVLELGRGSMVQKAVDTKKYLVVRVKDIFFDDTQQIFIRKYNIREIIDNKLSHDVEEIESTDIESYTPVEKVMAKNSNLEYIVEGDKEKDLEDDADEMDILEPMNEEDIVNDMDLDIEIDEDSSNNTNEDGFEFEEIDNEDIVISVEQELEESDILFTENEQEEDIIDELIRNLPDVEKQNRGEIKKIIKLVRNFQYLKFKHSACSQEAHKNLEEDQLLDLKKKIIIKSSNYKPLLAQYLKNNHDNKFLIPLINSQNQEYYDSHADENKDKLPPKILEQIEIIEKIYTKYKNNKELDFESLSNEIENLVKDKSIDTKYNTQHITRIPQDSLVINNLDISEEENMNLRNILGHDYREDAFGNNIIVNKGERVNLVGYVELPRIAKNTQYICNAPEKENISSLYRDALLNRDIEVTTLNYNDRYQKNDKVKVCINMENPEDTEAGTEKLTVTGKIVESRRGFIYLEPDDERLIDKNRDILEFDINSEMLKISKIEDIKGVKEKCERDSDKIKIYEFPSRIINDIQKENMLDQIVPSIKQILDREYQDLKNVLHFGHVNQILNKYGVSYSDLEYQNEYRIKNILYKNEKKLSQSSLADMAKINRMKSNYDKDLKEEQQKRMKNDIPSISNMELDSSKNIYTDYLYRPYTFDSTEERVNWLHGQEDKGKFIIYNKILLKLQAEKRKIKLGNLQGKLEETKLENIKIKSKLDEEQRKNDFFNPSKESKCRELKNKIVKIYLDMNQLKKDENKKITVDSFYAIGDISNPINLVKVGDYCICKNPNDPSPEIEKITMNDKIFKRVLIEDAEREVWAMDSRLKIADYLRQTREMCQNLVEDNKDPSMCKLDLSRGQCLPERIQRLRKGYESNELLIRRLEEQLDKLGQDNKEKLLEKEIKRLEIRGKLNLKNELEKTKRKIEQIRKLQNDYPVDYDTSENNTYEYLKQLEEELSNPEKKQELLLHIREAYGIDFIEPDIVDQDERELFTQGDFNDKGQRIEFAEVMPGSQKEVVEQSNSDILDAIRNFLNDSVQEDLYGDTYHSEDDMNIIRELINTMTNIMGVKLDIDKIDKVCAVLVEDNLVSKSDYINQKYLLKGKAMPKQSKVDDQYNAYKLQIIIFLTLGRLLIHLQLNLTNYFMIPYQKCVSSLYGYPLINGEEDDKNMTAINYVVCILDNLKTSGKYWNSIQEYNKSKLSKKLMTYLEAILINNSLGNELQNKYLEIEENRMRMDLIEQQYIWNEFRPPLNDSDSNWNKPPSVDLGDTNIKSKKSFDNAVSLFQERSLWISLKIVDRINNIVSSQEIENIKYDPLPISNSCCLSKINGDYNYLDFLNENDSNKDLNTYIKESRNMEYVGQKLQSDIQELIYVLPTEYKIAIKTFKNNIFPTQKQIQKNNSLVKSLFVNFIDSGYYQGKKRNYDSQNICSDTGENKKNIEGKAYSVDNFTDLLSIIHSQNKVGVISSGKKIELDENNQPSFNHNLQFLLKKLKKCINHPMLLSHDFIKDLHEKEIDELIELKKSDTAKIWEILDREAKNAETNLLARLGRHLDKSNLQSVKNIIGNLEMFEKLEDMDRRIIEDVEGKLEKSKMKFQLENKKYIRLCQMMRKYIVNYVCKYIQVLSYSNNSMPNINISDDSEVRMRKSQKTLMDLNIEEYESLDKFRNKMCRKIFKNLKTEIKGLTKINNIKGYQDVYDCQHNVIYKSKFNHYITYQLLKLIFFHLLESIIEMSDSEKSGKAKKSKKSISMSEDEEDDIVFEVGTSNSVLISNYVYTIFKLIDKDRTFTNKNSQLLVDKNIKTRNEESKDRNLHVMELLDLETRRLRNEQTKAGLTKYADLASDFQDVIHQEEKDNILREEYKRTMGDNYTDEGFDSYKENKMREDKLESEIRGDNEEYLDAEGDEELDI